MKFIARLWHQFCGIYTVSALILLLLNLMISGTLAESIINAKAFLLLFLFALAFAFANVLLRVSGIPYAGRVALHFVIVLLGSYCCLYLPNNAASASSGKLMMLLIMVVVYWAIMGLYLARSAKHRALEGKKDAGAYHSVYGAAKGK